MYDHCEISNQVYANKVNNIQPAQTRKLYYLTTIKQITPHPTK